MKNKEKEGFGTMDLILIIIGITTAAFIVTMIILFVRFGAIPDTLCTCYFMTIGGECGVMGWIRTSKERHRERKYEIEDRDYQERKESEDINGSNRNEQ